MLSEWRGASAPAGGGGKGGWGPLPVLGGSGRRASAWPQMTVADVGSKASTLLSPHPGDGAVVLLSRPQKPVAGILSFLCSSKEYFVSKVQSVSLPEELVSPPGLSDCGYLREQPVTYHFPQK